MSSAERNKKNGLDASDSGSSSPPTVSPVTITAEKKSQTIKAARIAKRTLSWAGMGLVAAFGFLKFHGLDFAPLLKDLNAQFLLQATLAFYYLCWVTGCSFDIDDQELLYVDPPDLRRVISMCVITVGAIVIPFGILCYVQSYRAFAVALTVFLVANVLCWIGLCYWVLRESVPATEKYYTDKKAYPKLLELKYFVDDYLEGPWQIWRFCAGAVIVSIIDIIAFTGLYEHLNILHRLGSKDFVLALLVLTFVLVMEIWIWAQRWQFRISRLHLDKIARSYNLQLKTSKIPQ